MKEPLMKPICHNGYFTSEASLNSYVKAYTKDDNSTDLCLSSGIVLNDAWLIVIILRYLTYSFGSMRLMFVDNIQFTIHGHALYTLNNLSLAKYGHPVISVMQIDLYNVYKYLRDNNLLNDILSVGDEWTF
jgi:hypothetical protein